LHDKRRQDLIEDMIENQSNLCRRVPPEDLHPGMFIVVLSVMHEMLAPGSMDDPALRTPRMLRIACTSCADGEPVRVLAVCLPFVQAEDARGELRTLDIRQHQLGAVAEGYALEVFTRPGRPCEDDD
jgi:hypothetical protein